MIFSLFLDRYFKNFKIVHRAFLISIEKKAVFWQFILALVLSLFKGFYPFLGLLFFKKLLLLFNSDSINIFAFFLLFFIGPMKLLSVLLRDYVLFLISRFIAEVFSTASSFYLQKIIFCRPNYTKNYSSPQLFAALAQAQNSFSVILFNLYFVILPHLLTLFFFCYSVVFILGIKYLVVLLIGLILQKFLFIDAVSDLNTLQKDFSKRHLSFVEIAEEAISNRSQISLGGQFTATDVIALLERSISSRKNSEIKFFQKSSYQKLKSAFLQAITYSAMASLTVLDLYFKKIVVLEALAIVVYLDKVIVNLSELLNSWRMLVNENCKLEAWNKIENLVDDGITSDCFECGVGGSKIISKKPRSFLELDEVVVKFGEKTVLKNFSAEFKESGLFVVRGKNGSGKSTLLNVLAGIVRPVEGSVYFMQQEYSSINADGMIDNFAYVEQNPKIFTRTVEENLWFGLPSGSDKKLSLEMREFLTEDFFVNSKAWSGYSGVNLSVGLIEKIRIVNACLRDTRVLILDEPTANLDESSKLKFYDLIAKQGVNKCVIVATHDIGLIDKAKIVIKLD